VNEPRTTSPFLGLLLCLVVLGPLPATADGPSKAANAQLPTHLLLVTLDTTRADHLGCYGGPPGRTPVLDRLAARGTRYAGALTPVPLTLPAHASILTGLDPRAHGLRDNGIGSLPEDVPTLATALAERGYATAGFAASRVLDRRFGLGRGFATYDDAMAAERLGEFGYPERDAAAVTDAALAWLERRPAERPFFLWVHYYDPHAPYAPPARFRGHGEYAGEIAYVDSQIGRLLAALPDGGARTVIAAVGDHGEALGEHGEDGHGIFLYGATLRVPLILAGPGVDKGAVKEGPVSLVDLAPHLLALLGVEARNENADTPAGGLASARRLGAAPQVFSETHMPANAYGWAPLAAVTDARYRLVRAPAPELYDLATDPGERRNVVAEQRPVVARLARALRDHEAAIPQRDAAQVAADEELATALRSLGYLGGASGKHGDGIDPKEGIELLEDFERAKRLLSQNAVDEALALFTRLVERNPANVPFLNRLAAAQLAAGRGEAAVATYRRAVERNPTLDFTHFQLAEAYLRLGRMQEAVAEYRVVLDINPRFADAWMRLAEHSSGSEEAVRLLDEAVAAGTQSAAVFSIRGELQRRLGRPREAEESARQAVELVPTWWPAWLLWGRLAEARGDVAAAEQRYRQALAIEPDNPPTLIALGRLLIGRGDEQGGRELLARAGALDGR
jgi:arylsulfatase A-like enzyme/Flp pilus assembly protein TadD